MAHRLAPEAQADLDGLWYHVATNASADVADRLVEAITSRVAILARYPEAGRRRDHDLRAGVRTFPVGAYLIAYRVEAEDVLVLRVIRGSRDIEALLNE